MTILSVANFILSAFLGYIVGRFGDNYVNIWIKDPPWIPHHWIFGLIMIIVGILNTEDNLGLWILSFGIGVFISDLKDFSEMKFFEPDKKTKETRRFWHID